MSDVTINVVTRNEAHGGYALVLVEEGPWASEDIVENLRRIQERLYGCLDAALDGLVAGRFPESMGKPLTIRLDAYDVAGTELADFFSRFTSIVPTLKDYAQALAECKHHPDIRFEINMARL